ncbi:MAG TPA: DUF5335 family protein [Pyrinomonadaceae bacterium]|nr:DUF5335 family protein [Pyrinomonadaceae bacterium]
MKTRVLQRTEWPDFFDSFSRQHEGWLTTLEVFGPDIGDQIEERDLTLEGVTAELADAGDKIEIMLGNKPNDHITRTISAPADVSLEQTDEGADVALAIKTQNGTTTLLRFRSAMLPEMVDAVAT